MAFTEQEIEEFKAEAIELLDVAEKSLLALDKGAEFRKAFDTIFRSFHNLKGGSGVMEMMELQAHTHELESIFMGFKEKTSIPKNYISFFLRGVDSARAILDGQSVKFDFTITEDVAAPIVESLLVETPTPDVSQSSVDEFIAESEEIIDRVSKHLSSIEAGSHSKDTLDETYRDIHSLKGAAYLFGYSVMGDVSHAMESSLEPLRNGTHNPSALLLDLLYKSIKTLEMELACVKNKTSDESVKNLVPVLAKDLADAVTKLELHAVVPQGKIVENPVAIAAVVENEASPKKEDNDLNASIRVPVSLLDNLMTLMGEMVLVRNQVLQFSNKSEDFEFVNLSQRLNVVTSEIQGEMMKTRMQPIGNIITKFNRVVRDLSHELKKSISLTISGAETELDKSLLEAIKDPLTHIVRNSCDHGIEMPEARRSSGKSEVGNISVKSYHEGGQVVIEVTDDGKGLHPEMLVKKGLEKGLITPAQATQMSDKEIYNLIFAPGFSTAAKVTNVSGRGVGMDVVRTNIERIGGTVDISSQAGQGTTIRLKIPLTLAIVPALIVNAGEGTFAIPQVKLNQLVRVDQSSENQIEYLQGTPVFRLRGDVLPLIDLGQVLGLRGKANYEGQVVNIAVLNAENHSFGLIVDGVQDTAEVVVKPINRLLKSLHVYSGATILGDGSVALILDVLGISKVAQLKHENASGDKNNLGLSAGATRSELAELQDFLLIRVNSPTKHALVLGYVNRLEEFKRSDLEVSGTQKVVRYRNTILPIISASEYLGYKVNSESQPAIFPVIVVERAGSLYGIEVDEIIDTLATTKETENSLVKHPGIIGNLSTENELIVVVDPYELISLAFPQTKASTAQAGNGLTVSGSSVPKATPVSSKILLVEDTIFFRKFVKKTLEEAGHSVETAVDGVDALEILNKASSDFDIIVSDIEMPRMNGFALAERVRASQRYGKIPLLALSSRSDRAHIEKGTQSGFNVYLEKMKPEVLLAAISDLVSVKKGKSA